LLRPCFHADESRAADGGSVGAGDGGSGARGGER
jgi:hypothetical protein